MVYETGVIIGALHSIIISYDRNQQHNHINCIVGSLSPEESCTVIYKDTSPTSSFIIEHVSIDFLGTFIMTHGHVNIEDGPEKNKIRQSQAQDDLIGPQPACFINRFALFFNLIIFMF